MFIQHTFRTAHVRSSCFVVGRKQHLWLLDRTLKLKIDTNNQHQVEVSKFQLSLGYSNFPLVWFTQTPGLLSRSTSFHRLARRLRLEVRRNLNTYVYTSTHTLHKCTLVLIRRLVTKLIVHLTQAWDHLVRKIKLWNLDLRSDVDFGICASKIGPVVRVQYGSPWSDGLIRSLFCRSIRTRVPNFSPWSDGRRWDASCSLLFLTCPSDEAFRLSPSRGNEPT